MYMKLKFIPNIALVRAKTTAALTTLAATSQAQHQVQSALLLNVVVGEGSSVLKLLSGKDKTLLVRWDTLLVLDLRLDVLNCVRALDLEGDSLTRQSLHEDLHTSSQAQHQVQSALLLNVVVGEGSSVLKLLSGKDKTLLVRWDTLLVLDLRLDVLNCVRALDLEGDSLTRQSLHEDLHGSFR